MADQTEVVCDEGTAAETLDEYEELVSSAPLESADVS